MKILRQPVNRESLIHSLTGKFRRYFLVAAFLLFQFSAIPFAIAAPGNPGNNPGTIQTWQGTFTDPTNGVAYTYNIVGADPRISNETTTIEVDIIPLNLIFTNGSLNGEDVIDRVLASPLFTPSDFSTTPLSTGSPNAPAELSAGNENVQYLDAVMRSQFNKTATNYHFVLHPNVMPTVTINIPNAVAKGGIMMNSRGIPYGRIDPKWMTSKILQVQTKMNPTHLVIFLTNNVLDAGDLGGVHYVYESTSSPNHPLQTFIIAPYFTPGVVDKITTRSEVYDPQIVNDQIIVNPDGTPNLYFGKDIIVLSHEMGEWAMDPFVSNVVNPLMFFHLYTGYAGCGNVLEVGDSVEFEGFAMPGNTFDNNAYSDGYYHLEDKAFLPWFARENPNVTSQPMQNGTTGRYTFMGNLNPYAPFHVPAADCPQ